MKTTNKPWLDEKGEILSENHLKEISKVWTHQEWEEYLKTQEVRLKEDLIEPRFYDELAARQKETIFQKFYFSADLETQRYIEGLLSSLSPIQKKILERIYFDGRSQRTIGKELGLPRATVHFHKKTALNRIKQQMSTSLRTSLYIGESAVKLKDAFEKIDELYQEGSLTKDERFLLWALVEVGGLYE